MHQAALSKDARAVVVRLAEAEVVVLVVLEAVLEAVLLESDGGGGGGPPGPPTRPGPFAPLEESLEPSRSLDESRVWPRFVRAFSSSWASVVVAVESLVELEAVLLALSLETAEVDELVSLELLAAVVSAVCKALVSCSIAWIMASSDDAVLSLLDDRLAVLAEAVEAELEVVVEVELDVALEADASSCSDVKNDNASEANILEPLLLGASDRAEADWEEVAELELDCKSCPVEEVALVALAALDCMALISAWSCASAPLLDVLDVCIGLTFENVFEPRIAAEANGNGRR